MFAARAAIGSVAVALLALVAVHILKRDLDPSRTMISRYALGPSGWLMALCFAAWQRRVSFSGRIHSIAFIQGNYGSLHVFALP